MFQKKVNTGFSGFRPNRIMVLFSLALASKASSSKAKDFAEYMHACMGFLNEKFVIQTCTRSLFSMVSYKFFTTIFCSKQSNLLDKSFN